MRMSLARIRLYSCLNPADRNCKSALWVSLSNNQHMEESMSLRNRFGAAIILLILSAGPVLAQTQFATITGRVVDNTGAIIVDAAVTLTDTATQTSRQGTTGQEGTFSFGAVVPSNYKLSVRKDGFKSVQKTFAVTP